MQGFALAGMAVIASMICHSWPEPAARPATRLVRAEVLVDGEVVLRASTSDDGSPDADAVWGYLRTLRFTATAGLARVPADRRAAVADTELVLLGRAIPARRPGEDPPPRQQDVRLDIAYGGEVAVRSLRLVPVPGRPEWTVDPAEVERWFEHRRIRRSWAAALDDPRRSTLPKAR